MLAQLTGRRTGLRGSEILHQGFKTRPLNQPRKGEKYLSMLEAFKARFDQLNRDPQFKKKAAGTLIVFYVVTAVFGIRYLQETKHKATGEAHPHQKSEGEDEAVPGIPVARNTTDVYEEMAEEYDSKIWWEEFLSYIWLKRRKVMKMVEGDVLEVSCGTGRNVSYFKPSQVNSIVFVDTSEAMLQVCKRKFEKKFKDFTNVQYVKGRAENLGKITEKSGMKFDTIYESFGLCSHEDPGAALQNFKRLLKPNGKIILLEHGRSDRDSLNERMDKRAESRAKEWGCRWNLDIDDIVQKAGFEIVEQERYHFGTTYFYVLKPAQPEQSENTLAPVDKAPKSDN
ncbi:methyltransferase Oms1p, mitochondrial [Trichomonascus vanleenenianus]|uniref:putative RNA methyltransferase n=1 Tax=Trichomonascus vanleenenianus TaxID=2268995 RepID=UPI003ECA34ED